MVHKHMKESDGFYHIKGVKYPILEGSRAQVWHKTAHHTPGGLTRDQLLMNKHGRVVSKKKHNVAKREKRLEKAGYFTRKGEFGAVKGSPKKKTKGSPKKRTVKRNKRR